MALVDREWHPLFISSNFISMQRNSIKTNNKIQFSIFFFFFSLIENFDVGNPQKIYTKLLFCLFMEEQWKKLDQFELENRRVILVVK